MRGVGCRGAMPVRTADCCAGAAPHEQHDASKNHDVMGVAVRMDLRMNDGVTEGSVQPHVLCHSLLKKHSLRGNGLSRAHLCIINTVALDQRILTIKKHCCTAKGMATGLT